MKQKPSPRRKRSSAKSVLRLPDLAPGTINLRLGAVRRLAYEAADCVSSALIWRRVFVALKA